jgi:MFS superfamily sulfate permease-like transporter
MRIKDITVRFHGKALKVGKKILEMIADFYKRFPKTSVTILLFTAMAWVVGSIPVLGPLLKSLAIIIGCMVTCIAFLLDLFRSSDEQDRYRDFKRQVGRRLGFLAG